jgi:hypothetical protein
MSSGSESEDLRTQLRELVHRDAVYRAKTVQEFLELKKTIKLQAEEAERLRKKISERDTYIHELHLEREALKKQIPQAHADLEVFTRWLAQREGDSEKLKAIRASMAWSAAAPFRWLESAFVRPTRPTSGIEAVSPGPFTYFLHTSPYRVYREGAFTLRGWVFENSQRPITAIRARVDATDFAGNSGLPEPEVCAQRGLAHQPGFQVEIQTPPGRHRLELHAQLENAEWRSFLSTPIWVLPP